MAAAGRGEVAFGLAAQLSGLTLDVSCAMLPTEATIRVATEADRDAVAEVTASGTATLRRCYRPNAAAVAKKRSVAASLTRLVACLDQRVVGTVQYRTDDVSLHMIGLDVLEAYRRRGVAAQLVEYLTAVAIRRGLASITLYTIRETGNESIFSRLGFITRREAPATDFESDRFHDLTEVFMEKTVRG